MTSIILWRFRDREILSRDRDIVSRDHDLVSRNHYPDISTWYIEMRSRRLDKKKLLDVPNQHRR